MIQDILTHGLINSDYHNSYLLNRIIALSTSSLSLHEILNRICGELAQSTGALSSAFALIDAPDGQLNIRAEYHCASRTSSYNRFLLVGDNPVFDKLIAEQTPIIVAPDPFEPLTTLLRNLFHANITEKLLVIPLPIQPHAKGLFGIVSENLQDFTSEDISLALGITQLVALLIEKESLSKSQHSVQGEKQHLESEIGTRLDLEKIIQQSAIRLIQLSSAEIDLGIREILEILGKFAQVDRSFIYSIDPVRQMFRMTHEWARPTMKPMIHSRPEFPTRDYPWWMEKLSAGEVIHLANLDEIPVEATTERATMESQSVRSMLAVPILSIDTLFGFIGFTAEKNERSWSGDFVVLLKIVGSAIANLFQRQEVEQELRLQRDFAIQIMNTMGQGLVVSDENDRFEYLNPAFTNMLGYSQEELIGKTPRDIINLADLSTVEEAHFNRKHGQSDVYEIRLHRKDGSELFSLINAVPLMGNGISQGSIAVITDLTERKQAEYDLRQNESAIRNLYGIASDQSLNHSARIQALLIMGCQLFQMRNGALVRNQKDRFWIVEVQSLDAELYKGMPLEPEQVQQFGLLMDEKNSNETGGLDAGYFLTSPVIVSNEIYGFLTFFDPQDLHPTHRSNVYEFLRLMAQWLGSEIERASQLIQLKDNTEEIYSKNQALALANEQALQAVRLKADFLATMSHEIRTPLNTVIGMSELMLTTQLDQRQIEYASIVRDSSQALLSLINDILDFSKIEAGRLVLENIDFQIPALLEGAADLLAARAQQKKLALMTYADPAIPPMVRGDFGRLRQILLNLIGNAVKFTDHGEVVASAMLESREGQNVVIKFLIRDTGIGISKEVKKMLFQPFTQADSSMARKYGGTGLGLSISAHLVELMGGEIGVESQEGYGATFWFTVSFERSAATVPIVNRPRRTGLDEIRVLVIDSNTTELDIIHRYLDAWGIFNTKASDSSQALQYLEESAKAGQPYDIVIIDQSVFDSDSFNLDQDIIGRPSLAGLRLIKLISFDDIDQRDRALQAEFSTSLNKPVKQSSLLDAITNLVSNHPDLSGLDHLSTSAEKTDKLPRRLPNPNLLILIAEDNPANQKMVLYQLEKLGYNGHAVANGLEAIQALATIPEDSRGYDLVLMDCQMPEMDGFETTHRIRINEAENGQHIPIVAMTANAMQGDREACLEAGMDDYVAKPVTLNSLQHVLEQYLPNNKTMENDDQTQSETVAAGELGGGYEDVLDQNALDSIRQLQSEIDSNLLNELIELFLSEGPKLLDTIEKAILEKDAKGIQFAAHRLKGSSAYLGVIKVRSISSEMEEQSREYELDNLDFLFPKLKTEYRRATLALRHQQQSDP